MRFGIVPSARPVRPSVGGADGQPCQRATELAQSRRIEDRPVLEWLDRFERLRPQLGREIHQVVFCDGLAGIRRRFGRKRLRGRVPFAWHVAFWRWALLDWPDWL